MSRSAATAASDTSSNVSQHDQEFVAPQTGRGVLFTRKSLKPFCDFLQEEVADRVPQ